jgi:hypothetical protein
MRSKKTLSYEGTAKLMTIVEIEDALAAARDAGATGDTVPKVRIAFGGGIQLVRIEIETAQDASQQ